MFRIFTQKAVKAVPRPTTRLVHNIGHPYTGPASYDTIMRRLNSDIDPQSFSIWKRQQECKAYGKFIDIHDIGTERFYFDASFPNVNHETLFPDIDHETLNTKIAEELGIPYLSKASEGEAKKMVSVAHAYIYGQNCRTIVPFIVCCDNEARWVFFIVDNVCPLTYFSAQVSKLTHELRSKPGMLKNLDKQSSRFYRKEIPGWD